MRLAFLADAALVHTVRWVNHFAARGHDCMLASLERGSGFLCRVHELPQHASLPRWARYTLEIPTVRTLLRDFRPEVVNAHFLPNYGWMAARAGARPLVLTTLGSDILLVPAQSPLHRWRTRHVLSRCDRVIADAAMLSAAIASFGVPAERILTVPMGIETGRFAAAGERAAAPPLVLLSTRRLETVYDVETLLRAYEMVAGEERAGLALRIAGDGARAAELRARARHLPVAFLGWLAAAEIDRELLGAHVYVSTSRSDSTSVSLLEAMAAGCFPVVSDIPANREWVRDGETGLLFPAGDAASLAACLRRAAADPVLRQRAAQANRRIIAERASWDVNMAQVESLFAELRAAP